MPYANNNGVKIYYEVEGEGPPLVLAHAIMSSLTDWRTFGYADALKTDYRLVLFDARGRGRTDKPRQASAYEYSVLATDVLTVLDDLGIDRAHYLGYSMGARVGFLLATRNAARFNSFILGGNTPYQIPVGTVKTMTDLIEGHKLLRADPESYLQQMARRLGQPLTPEQRQRYLAQDADTLIAMESAWLDSPSLKDHDLSRISLPCLIYCGDIDQGGFHAAALECVDHIPNANFVSLAGCDHSTAMVRSHLILPHIKEFLARVSKK